MTGYAALLFRRIKTSRLREDPEQLQTIRLEQPVADNGGRVGRVGAVLGATPFDSFGRRTYTLITPKGEIDVIQGITEISPLWTRVEGLQSKQPFIWDMRIATNSIPRDVLSRILRQHLGSDDPDSRLQVVKLYLQSERYQDAERELSETIREFPKLATFQQQVIELRQQKAKQLLGEIKNLRDGGQHQRVLAFLKNFPTERIANETLIEVREILGQYQATAEKANRIRQLFSQGIDSLERGPQRDKLLLFQDELDRDLDFDTVGRLTGFLNLADDEKVAAQQRLSAEQKLSLAVSGWLLGSQYSVNNLAVSMSLLEVRRLVQEYLSTESTDSSRRKQILQMLQSLEGSSPQQIARLLIHIPPPRKTEKLQRQVAIARGQATPSEENGMTLEEETAATKFGMLELSVPTPTGNVNYLVQLPPEYHPFRRYPAVVTLHASGTTPEIQLDWWAGAYDPKTHRRTGQAGRHGYIVIAPQWSSARQREYEYTVSEHAAVLASLRDAMQRFSIDSDRVFLSGHEIGGERRLGYRTCASRFMGRCDAGWSRIGLSQKELTQVCSSILGKRPESSALLRRRGACRAETDP